MGLLWGVIDRLEWSKDSEREFWIALETSKGSSRLASEERQDATTTVVSRCFGYGSFDGCSWDCSEGLLGWTCGPLMTAKVETTSLASKQRIKNPEKNKHPFCRKSLNSPKRWSAAQGAVPSFDLETQKLKLTDHRILLNKVYKKMCFVHWSKGPQGPHSKKPVQDSPLTSQPRGQVVAVARKAQCLATQKHHEQTPKTCKTHQSSPSCRFNCYQFLLFLLV